MYLCDIPPDIAIICKLDKSERHSYLPNCQAKNVSNEVIATWSAVDLLFANIYQRIEFSETKFYGRHFMQFLNAIATK